jgi:imidazolonepropionase-like amidohydrolase
MAKLSVKWRLAVCLMPNEIGGCEVSETLVVKNVTVIDGTGAAPTVGVDLVVKDGRIVTIGAQAGDAVDGRVIEGSGQYLIPGLWETEAHLTRPVTGVLDDLALDSVEQIDTPATEGHLAAYLSYGFTTVVDLGGPEEYLSRLRAKQESGEIRGARLLFTGRQFTAVDGPPSNPDGKRWATVTVDVDTVDDARAALERMKGYGIDAIKVNMPGPNPMHKDGPTISDEILRMLVSEGEANALPVHVHIDTPEAAIAALEAGVHNIEHMFEPNPDTVAADVERVTELCLRTGAYWPFTIALWEGLSRLGDPTLLEELEPERTVLPHVLERFLTHPASAWLQADDRMRSHYKTWFDAAMLYLPQVHAAGVKMTIASDAGAPGAFHGSAAKREMLLSVQAGLSPMDVLVAATSDSARKLRLDQNLGTLEVGKIADMVLLEASPLEDISNISRIGSVFQAGRPVELAARR